MQRQFFVTVLVCAAMSAGCDVTIVQDFDDTLVMGFGTPPQCDGEQTFEDEESTSTTTFTTVGESCQVDYLWSGVVLDMAETAQMIEEQAGGVISSVVVQDASGNLTAIDMLSGEEPVTLSSIEHWDTTATIVDETFFTVEADQATDFLAQPAPFDASQTILDELSVSLENRGVVTGSAVAQLVIPLTDFEALAELDDLHLDFAVEGAITVLVTVEKSQ